MKNTIAATPDYQQLASFTIKEIRIIHWNFHELVKSFLFSLNRLSTVCPQKDRKVITRTTERVDESMHFFPQEIADG